MTSELVVQGADSELITLDTTDTGTKRRPRHDAYVPDGNNVVEGMVADAAVAAGAAGTISGKMRRLTTDLAALIALVPASLGQKTKAAALPVTLASDEDILATLGATGDAVVAAGAAGSHSGKLRRLTTDIGAMLTALTGILGVKQQATVVVYGNVSVGVTATLIVAANANRLGATIHDNGSVPIYVGSDSSVTTANGIPIPSGESKYFNVTTDLYGISGTAAQDVRYLSERSV